jgi:hypothetical protein
LARGFQANNIEGGKEAGVFMECYRIPWSGNDVLVIFYFILNVY